MIIYKIGMIQQQNSGKVNKNIKMGGQQSQQLIPTSITSTSLTDITTFLKQYNLVCDVHHQDIGKLNIYRKTSYNYDYVCVLHKIIQSAFMDQLKVYLLLGHSNHSILTTCEHPTHINPYNFKSLSPNSDLWLKVFGCQLLEPLQQSQSHIQICLQYLTFTIQNYIQTPPSSLLTISSSPPNQLLYILSSIIKAYDNILSLHKSNQHIKLSLYPLITSITSPNLIYIDVEGCIKFLSLPLFIMPDFVRTVDKCVIQCCQWDDQTGRNFVAVGENKRGEEGLGRVERVFVGRLKRLIKWIIREIGGKTGIKKYSEDSKTQQPFSIKPQIASTNKSQLSFTNQSAFSQLQSLSSLQNFRQYLQINKKQTPSHLQFATTQQPQSRHPSSLSRQKIRLQKIYNSRKTQNQQNRTFSNFTEPSYDSPQAQLQDKADRQKYGKVGECKFQEQGGSVKGLRQDFGLRFQYL